MFFVFNLFLWIVYSNNIIEEVIGSFHQYSDIDF